MAKSLTDAVWQQYLQWPTAWPAGGVGGALDDDAHRLRPAVARGGANPQAAIHAGIPVSLLTLMVFALSAALAGLAGAVDIMGVQGNVRADWNPAYGLVV